MDDLRLMMMGMNRHYRQTREAFPFLFTGSTFDISSPHPLSLPYAISECESFSVFKDPRGPAVSSDSAPQDLAVHPRSQRISLFPAPQYHLDYASSLVDI